MGIIVWGGPCWPLGGALCACVYLCVCVLCVCVYMRACMCAPKASSSQMWFHGFQPTWTSKEKQLSQRNGGMPGEEGSALSTKDLSFWWFSWVSFFKEQPEHPQITYSLPHATEHGPCAPTVSLGTLTHLRPLGAAKTATVRRGLCGEVGSFLEGHFLLALATWSGCRRRRTGWLEHHQCQASNQLLPL